MEVQVHHLVSLGGWKDVISMMMMMMMMMMMIMMMM
jgi:hypothetical protein